MGNNELADLNYKEAIRLYTEAIGKDPQFKEAYNNRIITVFQPHLFTRTQAFFREFANALLNTDILI